ncbi:MAG: metallophosphatase domain-containing protein [Bacteroidales bacterium]|nr:metallophosphatase domain-containing protein [Bacteroidales bacterium]
MKLLHLSDTHGLHRKLGALPKADILVHSGDFMSDGRNQEELSDFLRWLRDLPYAHKVIVSGNHDLLMYRENFAEGLSDGTLHVLHNTSADIMGLKFHGLPMYIPDIRSGAYFRFIADIPQDTDILVSHEPPLGILDRPKGQFLKPYPSHAELTKRVQEVRPRYHLFGHEHDAYGILKQDGTVFSNAALLDRHYVLQRAPRLFIID